MPKVLISDKLSEKALHIFRERGIDVDYFPDLGGDKEKLAQALPHYDGLAIRSATKVTPELLEKAGELKVIGRAGIGVDNVDIREASKRGIIVMNTPFGNSVTTAEHAIALMFAVARQLPDACSSTRAGKWEKNRFMGVELFHKTLGIIGVGNIGSIVADRALGLHMKVLAFDPYLTEERAREIGVQKVELDDLLVRSDFISLHVPLTDKTRNILSAKAIAKTKKGVRIINCARGGLIDENALFEALQSGHAAGAALDVFSTEPAKDSPLFDLPNVVVTPHLGASTSEAQENVAIQVAQQMSDFLLTGAVQNALNMPSVTAEEAALMGPWIKLAGHLGSFIGQMTHEPIHGINILYDGMVAGMNLKALNAATVVGVMKAANPDVNMVSAPVVAKERGIRISTTTRDKSGVYDGFIKVTVMLEGRERCVAGTLFGGHEPRFIQVRDIKVDAEIGEYMLYTRNRDVPGVIGVLGTVLGKNGVNMANFALGRKATGGDAIAITYLDEPLPEQARLDLEATGVFGRIQPLRFQV